MTSPHVRFSICCVLVLVGGACAGESDDSPTLARAPEEAGAQLRSEAPNSVAVTEALRRGADSLIIDIGELSAQSLGNDPGRLPIADILTNWPREFAGINVTAAPVGEFTDSYTLMLGANGATLCVKFDTLGRAVTGPCQ